MPSLNFIALYWKKESKTYENKGWKKNLCRSTTSFVHVFHSREYLETLCLCAESEISDIFWPKLERVHKFKLK
jgi:hypothetical protein